MPQTDANGETLGKLSHRLNLFEERIQDTTQTHVDQTVQQTFWLDVWQTNPNPNPNPTQQKN